ncbi:MAG: DUF3037 domain-containing protein [Muribaculum sp.]|nr:DUF3037 domain-containing protein [Muribaculum sp.]
MHGKLLYEYAVIRYVPRVEREEFINVGLIMMCKRQRWVRVAIKVDSRKLEVYDSPLTEDELRRQLTEFELIGESLPGSGPMGGAEAEERFRWLTAIKSSMVQTSRPHIGLTDSLDATFDRLFTELV